MAALVCANNVACMFNGIYDSTNSNNDHDYIGNISDNNGHDYIENHGDHSPSFIDIDMGNNNDHSPSFMDIDMGNNHDHGLGFVDIDMGNNDDHGPGFVVNYDNDVLQVLPPPAPDPAVELNQALWGVSNNSGAIGMLVGQVDVPARRNLSLERLVEVCHFHFGNLLATFNILRPLFEFPELIHALQDHERALATYLFACSIINPVDAALQFNSIFNDGLDQHIGSVHYNPGNNQIEALVVTNNAVKAVFLAKACSVYFTVGDWQRVIQYLSPFFMGDAVACQADHINGIIARASILNALISAYLLSGHSTDAHDYVLANHNRISHTLSADAPITPTAVVQMNTNGQLHRNAALVLLHLFDALDDDGRMFLYGILRDAHTAVSVPNYSSVITILQPLIMGNSKLITKLPDNEKVFAVVLLTEAFCKNHNFPWAARSSDFIFGINDQIDNNLFACIGHFPQNFAGNLFNVNADERVAKAKFLELAAVAYKQNDNATREQECLERLLFNEHGVRYITHIYSRPSMRNFLPFIKRLIHTYIDLGTSRPYIRSIRSQIANLLKLAFARRLFPNRGKVDIFQFNQTEQKFLRDYHLSK
ncbi:hypothetical protein FACS189472_07480 [Alphaproteobacteria bacterium]|nr:hypothetical protein FACS189472_07480 [Alphaproteobacteria bacterium]